MEKAAQNGPARQVRAQFLKAGAVAGAGLIAVAAVPREAAAAASCGETVQEVLSTLLLAEQLAATLYFTGLSTRAVVGHPYLAGSSGDPNRVASNGTRVNVAALQAALDQERRHANILIGQGAVATHTEFYFPATTFATLGYTREAGSFLWVLDHIETIMVGAYLVAVRRFATLGKANLTVLASRMLGPECQHRALGRIIAGDTPANNVGLEVSSFACTGDAATALHPYVTGQGFAAGTTAGIPLPTPSAMARVTGKNTSG